MAIQKQIELENGMILNYHRIVSLNKITNKENIIEVASYINEQQREKEKEYYESTDVEKNMNVLIETTHVIKSYNKDETIEDSYSYLKATDTFKDAIDV